MTRTRARFSASSRGELPLEIYQIAAEQARDALDLRREAGEDLR